MIKKLFNFALLLCMLVLGAGNAWGEEVIVTKTTNDLVTENDWTISSGTTINTLATNFALDDVITISTTGEANCGSIWGTTTYDWRLYQNKSGDVIIKAADGYELVSVKLTYNISNSGTLIDGSTTVKSGTEISVTGTEKRLIVGNTESATNGQVRITQFTVTYKEGSGNTEESIANTPETAYSTTEAIALIDANSAQLATTEVYVKGTISQVDSYNATYGSITYWLDDNAFEIYGGLGLNGAKFTAKTDLVVGDEVVVKGIIKKYNTTYEMDKNNVLISRKTTSTQQPANFTIGTYKSYMTVGDDADTYTVSYDGDGELSVKSSDEAVATVVLNGTTVTVTPIKAGTTTITVSASETEKYFAAEKKYTLTVTAPAVAAELPFVFDGGRADVASTQGMNQNGLGTDYGSSPKLKFDGTGDNLVINYASSAKILEYSIKGNPASGDWAGTFDVLESADGAEYSIVASYTTLSKTAVSMEYELLAASRYVKFVLKEKDNGNVALGSIKISDTVELADPELSFSKTSYTFTIGSEDMAVIATSAAGSEGAITYALTEGDADAFLIDENTGDIVCETAGTYTVTATIAATSEYKSATATATITIREIPADVNTVTLVAEKEGKFYAANNTIEGSNKYFVTTEVNAVNNKVINIDKTTAETLTWYVTINGTEATVTNPNGVYLSLSSSSTAVVLNEEETTLYTEDGIFYAKENSRAFAYNPQAPRMASYNAGTTYPAAKAMTFADGYVREITLGEDETEKIGTICLDRTIEAEDLGGAKFYSIEGKVMDGDDVAYLTLEEETNGLIAGYPYIFIATGNVVAAYTGDVEAATAESNNGLVGSLDGCNVEQDKYLISGNKLVKCGTDCKIGANRAYVDMTKVPEVKASEVKGLILGTNGLVDGIQSMSAAGNNNVIYNLAGQRMSKVQKGLYIVNGKKVVK